MNSPMTTPDQNAWEPWEPWEPVELSRRLNGISNPWCIVGGWALDLWHGCQTRPHEDIEFTILREDVDIFRRSLHDIELYTVNDGVLERLASDQKPTETIFQIWCFDRTASVWRADMMIEPGTKENWVYKRDPDITRPRTDMIARTANGIPYLNPSAVLLFKAKYQRLKDETDFANTAPKLLVSERRWLRGCLERLHSDHEWSAKLLVE